MLARITKLTLIVAAVASLAVPTPAHAAESLGMSLRTAPKIIEHNGKSFLVRLYADKLTFGRDSLNAVTVSITRVLDSDGDGPLRSQRSAAWNFFGVSGFEAETDMSAATLDTGTELAPESSMDLKFEPTTRATSVCDGEARMRAGRLKGTFSLKTRSRFGTLSFRNWRAKLFNAPFGCMPVAIDRGPLPCPPPIGVLFAFDAGFNGFGAIRGPRRSFVFALSGGPLAVNSEDVFASRDMTVFVRIPKKRIKIDEQLRSASLQGAKGVHLKGHAHFDARGGLTTHTDRCGPRGAGTEAVIMSRTGVVTGDLYANMLIGDDLDFTGQKLDGGAERAFTRSR